MVGRNNLACGVAVSLLILAAGCAPVQPGLEHPEGDFADEVVAPEPTPDVVSLYLSLISLAKQYRRN